MVLMSSVCHNIPDHKLQQNFILKEPIQKKNAPHMHMHFFIF